MNTIRCLWCVSHRETCHSAGIATKRLPGPCDPIALAKLIGDFVTGQVADAVEDGKNLAAAELGQAGSTEPEHVMHSGPRRLRQLVS